MAAFDPTGSLMEKRFLKGDYLNDSTVDLIWKIPELVPATWMPNKNSPYEKQAVSTIENKLNDKFIVFSNVPLSYIFRVNEAETKKIVSSLIQKYMLKHSTEEKLISRCTAAMKTCIGNKSVDILMCHKVDGKIYGGIEIDGVHHFNDRNQRNYDFIKSKLFREKILTLARVNTQGLSKSNPWTPSQEDFFISKIMNYKPAWNKFKVNPSIEAMQAHNPDQAH